MLKDLEILLLTVEEPTAVCGKNVSMGRIAEGLRARGLAAGVVSLAEHRPAEIVAAARGGRARVVHSFHAWKAGRAGRDIAAALAVAHVVTLSGTDLEQDAHDPARRAAIFDVLNDAAAVLVSHGSGRERLLHEWHVTAPVHVIPKGVSLPEPEPGYVPDAGAGELIFLLPGGWRPVKNNLFPLEPLAALARVRPEVRLCYAGPVLDRDYHAGFLGERGRRPFARDLGVLPRGRMAAWLARADVVLNVSHSEGGANAVLEGMASGRAVLASDIPGNRGFVRFDDGDWHSSTGVLYRALPTADPRRLAHAAEDFGEKAGRLAAEPELRRTLGENARRWVAAHHAPAAESAALEAVYGERAGAARAARKRAT